MLLVFHVRLVFVVFMQRWRAGGGQMAVIKHVDAI